MCFRIKVSQGMGQTLNAPRRLTTLAGTAIPPNPFTTKRLRYRTETPRYQPALRTSRARNPLQAGLRTLRSVAPATWGPLIPLGYPNAINSFLTLSLLATPNLLPGKSCDNRTYTGTRRDIIPVCEEGTATRALPSGTRFMVGDAGRTVVDDGVREFTWN